MSKLKMVKNSAGKKVPFYAADGKDDQRSLGEPVIWAGMFITNKLIP